MSLFRADATAALPRQRDTPSSPSFDKREQEVQALYDMPMRPQLHSVDWQCLGFTVGLRGRVGRLFKRRKLAELRQVSLAHHPTLNQGSTSPSSSVEDDEAM